MPEHVHLLLSEPKKGTPSTVLQMLKQRVSRKMRKRTTGNRRQPARLLFPELAENLRQFWQARFYDFNVYTERKKAREARLHASQPGDPQAGGAPAGLAVEQLSLVRKRREGTAYHRSRVAIHSPQEPTLTKKL
jgi:hypothetical protein